MNTFAAHLISDLNDFTFNVKRYSQFKYGSKRATKSLAKDLFERFRKSNTFKDFLQESEGKNILLVPSSYYYVPTASCALGHYFMKRLNVELIKQSRRPAELGRIYRATNYIADYAKMTGEDREKYISGDSYRVDFEQWDNTYIIFLDDVRITGSHERRVNELIKKAESSNITFSYLHMYYAMVSERVTMPPQIEDYLNTNFFQENSKRLTYIIRNHDIILNTRTIKFILGLESIIFQDFIAHQSDDFKINLLVASYGNGYHTKNEYQENLHYLKQDIDTELDSHSISQFNLSNY